MLPLMLFLISTPTILCAELPYRPYTDNKTEEEKKLGDDSYDTNHLKEVLFAPVTIKKYEKPILPVPMRKYKEPRPPIPAYVSKITDDVKKFHVEPVKSSINQHNNVEPSAVLNNKNKNIGTRHKYKEIYKKKGDHDFRVLPNAFNNVPKTLETVTRTEKPTTIGIMSGPSDRKLTNYERTRLYVKSQNENKLLGSKMRYPGVFIDYRRMNNTDTLGSVQVEVTTPIVETPFHPLSHKLYLKQYPEYRKPKILLNIKISPHDSYRYNAIEPGDSLPIFKHMHQKDPPTI